MASDRAVLDLTAERLVVRVLGLLAELGSRLSPPDLPQEDARILFEIAQMDRHPLEIRQPEEVRNAEGVPNLRSPVSSAGLEPAALPLGKGCSSD
jgi:hypothetical protein